MHHEKENVQTPERKIEIQKERILLLQDRIDSQRKQIKRLIEACPFRQAIREALFYLGSGSGQSVANQRAMVLLRTVLEEQK